MNSLRQQDEKLNSIWVTDLLACPRIRYHRARGTDELPDHFLQVKGHKCHEAISKTLSGQPVDISVEDFPEAEQSIIGTANLISSRISEWAKGKDLGDAGFEVRLEMPLRDGYKLVGKIDLVTPEMIVDFKTGSKRNTLEYRIQLLAYEMLAKYNGLVDPDAKIKLINVFLGDGVEELEPYQSKRVSKDDDLKVLQAMIDEAISNSEVIKAGIAPPCKNDLGECALCRFRHICRGA